MPVRIVQSKQNARLKELRRALAAPGRGAGSEGRGLAGIEGPNLIEEALRAHLRVPCVFAAQGFEHLLETLPLPTESPQPVAALVEPPGWTWAHLLDRPGLTAPLLVVLAALQDPGNLGAILRSAEAFGADGVLCLPGTVSPWNPKSVRASAGSVFRLPLLATSETELLSHLRKAGVRLWTTTTHQAQPADLVDLAGPVALLIGNEGNGVPGSLASKAEGALTIPCPGPVESLNAAVAASVLLYEASRQRAARSGGPQQHLGGRR
jgi:TrmH family RNA methyltransferase